MDNEEKKLIIYDLMKAEPLQGNLDVKNCNINHSKNWLGNNVTQKIGDWVTKKYVNMG